MRKIACLAGVPLVVAGVLSPVASAKDDVTRDSAASCGRIHVVGINGQGDSTFGTGANTDAGFIGDNVVVPVMERLGQPVGQDASGGIAEASSSSSLASTSAVTDVSSDEAPATTTTTAAGGGGESPGLTRTYINLEVGSTDTSTAKAKAEDVMRKVQDTCGDSTRIVLVGFAEGAPVASRLAEEIGNGTGVIPASRVAGVAVFSDATRAASSPPVVGGGDLPDGMSVETASEPASSVSVTPSVSASSSTPATSSVSAMPTTVGTTAAVPSPSSPSSATATATLSPFATPPDSPSASSPSSSSVGAFELPTPAASTPEFGVPGASPRATDSPMVDGGLLGSFPEGGGIAAEGAQQFGELASKTVSWCLSGDLVCGMPPGSATRQIADAIAPDFDTNNPTRTLTAIADTLGPAVALGGLEAVAEGVSFGPNGFEVSRAENPEDTLIGRIAGEAQRTDNRDIGEMGLRALTAASKIAGMGLAAGMTVAKDVITPANIAALTSAGMTNPVAGMVAAAPTIAASLATAAMDLVSPTTATGVAARVFDEAQAAGLDEQALASVATDAVTWQQLASSEGYATTPVTAGGLTPAGATVEWLSQLAGGHNYKPSTPSSMPTFNADRMSEFMNQLA